MNIRKLGPQDVGIWRKIRLEGLQAYPQNFLTQYADVVKTPLTDLAEQLRTSETFVAFDGEEPIASMGYLLDDRLAVRHCATIVAVYVRKAWQGKGTADALFKTVVDDLPDHVLQILLQVAASNPRAQRFYEKHGFKTVGTIPRATLIDGIATDDHIMVRMLD